MISALLMQLESAHALLSQRPAWASAVLVVVSLVMFVPGLGSLPVTDRDEARFAQASRQMVESGDWVDIRLGEQTRYKKPAGIYWLQSTVITTLGEGFRQTIWAYRLPSLVGATAAVLLTYWLALPLLGGGPALLAGVLLAACLLLGVEARLAKTDSVLLALIVAAQGVLVRAWLAKLPLGWGLCGLFWGALGAAILVKGPVAPLVVLLTALTLTLVTRQGHWLKALRPLPGVALMLAVAVPWYVAITLKTGGGFWNEAVLHDMLGKVAQGQESHGAPPGAYALAVWVTWWPGALLLALALPEIWRTRRTPSVIFLLAWIVPFWVVFELIATKLPHYVLPTYPALAILVAGVLKPTLQRRFSRFRQGVAGLFLSLPLALLVGVVVLASELKQPPPLVALLGLGASGLVAVVVMIALNRQSVGAVVAGLILSAATLNSSFFMAAADLQALWPSAQVAQLFDVSQTRTDCPAIQVISAGYNEPSLMFLSPGRLRYGGGADAAHFLVSEPCSVAVVGQAQSSAFRQTLGAELGSEAQPQAEINGLSLGGGDRVRLQVFVGSGLASAINATTGLSQP